MNDPVTTSEEWLSSLEQPGMPSLSAEAKKFCARCFRHRADGTPCGCVPSAPVESPTGAPGEEPKNTPPTVPLGEPELQRVLGDIKRAEQMVSDLCTGKRDWMMSIPARPDYDPDIIIAQALQGANAILSALSDPSLGEAITRCRTEVLKHMREMAGSTRGFAPGQDNPFTKDAAALETILNALSSLQRTDR